MGLHLHSTNAMATRSAIGYRKPSGEIVSIYCHWDGYPSHQMPILREHYTTLAAIKQLFKRGWLSVLRTDHGWDMAPKEPGPLHYTDRGESIKDNKPVTDANLVKALESWDQRACCEHLYVYVPGNGGKRGEWQHHPING